MDRPEEKAKERYPSPPWDPHYATGYATCWRENVEKRDQEIAALRLEINRLKGIGGEPVAFMDPNDGDVLSLRNYEDRVPEGRIRYTSALYTRPADLPAIVETVMVECEDCYKRGLSGSRGWSVYKEELRTRLTDTLGK